MIFSEGCDDCLSEALSDIIEEMEVDRTKVCPLLLRCFWKMNRGYPLSAYRETPKDIYPNQEVQIYTWRDASLKEIGGLLKDVVPAAREPGSILSFSIVFLDKNGDFDIKQVCS